MAVLSFILIATFTIERALGSTETNITESKTINGNMLIELGRQMNKPMMTFIGMAIQNLHQCEEWTVWTRCEAKVMGNFGIRKRTRKCVKDTDKNKMNESVEIDWNLCEESAENSTKDICPSHYSFTAHGFCIKYYSTSKSHADADKQCQQDAGYLINIDSEEKYADVKRMSGTGDIWVGGRRKGNSNTWEFLYGQNNEFYSKYWFSTSYPGGDACLAIENYKWWTSSCTRTWPFLCEITSS